MVMTCVVNTAWMHYYCIGTSRNRVAERLQRTYINSAGHMTYVHALHLPHASAQNTFTQTCNIYDINLNLIRCLEEPTACNYDTHADTCHSFSGVAERLYVDTCAL